MEFYPSDLRFAQDSIANYFRDGRTLQESFRSLLNVDRPESVLPQMDVMHHDGFYFVTDGNRRLYLLKLLESEGLVNGKVKVNMTSFNENKYTTDNNGRSVRVRGRGNMEQMLKSILRERGHINKKRNLRSPNRNVSTNNRNMDQNYNRATIFGHIPKSIPSESHFQPQAIPPTPPQIVKTDNYNQYPTLSNSGAFYTSYNRGVSTLNTGSGSWHQNSGSATSQWATPSAVGFYRISPSETYSSSTSGGSVRASSRVGDNSGAFSTSYNRGLSTLNTGSGSWHQNSGSATSQCATPSAVGFYRISPSETYSSSTSGGSVRASSRVGDNSGAFSTSYNRGLSTLNTGSGSWHQNSGSATSQCATPSAVGFYRISPSETYSSSTSGGTVRASSRVGDSTLTRQETTRIDMTSTMDAHSFSSNEQKRDYSTSRKKRTGCGCTIL